MGLKKKINWEFLVRRNIFFLSKAKFKKKINDLVISNYKITEKTKAKL